VTGRLALAGVSAGYDQVLAISDIELIVADREIVAVVGANGAGKTTLLGTIAGLVRARAGSIRFDDVELSALPAHEVVTLGVALVAEGGCLFPFMTVEENLELGAFHAGARRHAKRALAEVFEHFPILAERRSQLAGRLSGGERQMCAIARAVMSQPRLLMLDEPSLGLAPIMVERVFELMCGLVAAKGLTVLLVEQNVSDALRMCRNAYIMERGQIVKQGTGASLINDPDVQRAYMGL
jgi:branched-chain amino acid transport system ATP-binding protein